MKEKLILFPDELIKAIQEYADTHTEGNFSMAVRQLSKFGIDQINRLTQ